MAGKLPVDFDLYSLDGQNIAVDFVGRFEHLADDLARALREIGFEDPVSLTKEKADTRPADAGVSTYFDPETSAEVERRFTREIATFGYQPPTLIGEDETA